MHSGLPATGFQILCHGGTSIINGIPDPLSCIPDSKAQDSGNYKKKIPGFRNQ